MTEAPDPQTENDAPQLSTPNVTSSEMAVETKQRTVRERMDTPPHTTGEKPPAKAQRWYQEDSNLWAKAVQAQIEGRTEEGQVGDPTSVHPHEAEGACAAEPQAENAELDKNKDEGAAEEQQNIGEASEK